MMPGFVPYGAGEQNPGGEEEVWSAPNDQRTGGGESGTGNDQSTGGGWGANESVVPDPEGTW